MDYSEYLDRMIVEIADRQSRDEIQSVRLDAIHSALFPDEPRSWLESLASELHRQGLGVDWQATDNLSFRPNGALFAKAAAIRKQAKNDLPALRSVDWSKWGAIAGIVALPLAILLAWLFA